MSALATTMFLGAGRSPVLAGAVRRAHRGTAVVAEIASLLIFSLNALLRLRGHVAALDAPRIRVDQMMNMCWKYLVPASFAGVLFVAIWMLIVNAAPGWAWRCGSPSPPSAR